MREDSGLDFDAGGGVVDLNGNEVSTLSEPRAVSQQGSRGSGFSLPQMLVEGGILSSDQVSRAQEEARR